MARSTRPYPGLGAWVIVLNDVAYAGARTEERARAKARRELSRHAGAWRVVSNEAQPASPVAAGRPAPGGLFGWDRETGGGL
jgi:hypothetical protein